MCKEGREERKEAEGLAQIPTASKQQKWNLTPDLPGFRVHFNYWAILLHSWVYVDY